MMMLILVNLSMYTDRAQVEAMPVRYFASRACMKGMEGAILRASCCRGRNDGNW